MDNKLSELSKPVAWTWNAYGMQHATTEEDESAELILDGVDVNPLYSQEYVSALLSQIEADREIKARLCRESNSLHDGLKAAEKRIAELEAKLATPVRLPKRYVISLYDDIDWEPHPNGDSYACEEVIVALREQGFTVVEDE